MRKVLIIIGIMLFASPLWGATVYVSSGGSNTSPYDTWAKAATTIATGIGAASPGDTVEIDGGVSGASYAEKIDIDGKDGSGTYYILKGSEEGSHDGTVTINPSNPANGISVHIHGGSHYWKIQNITVDSTSNNSFSVYISQANYVYIEDCTFTGESDGSGEYACVQSMGASGTGQYIYVRNNVIGATFDLCVDLNNDTGAETRHCYVEDNTCYNYDYCGIKMRRVNYGEIRRNYVYGPRTTDTNDSKIFMLRNSDYILIENNVGVFVNEPGTGSPIYKHYVELRGPTGCLENGSSNNVIQNNTFVWDTTNNPSGAVHFADDSSDNIIQNNIFEGTFSYFTSCWDPTCGRTGNVVRNNLVTGTVSDWTECSDEDSGCSFSNNTASGTTNWNESGDKPSPYWDITSGTNGTATGGNGYGVPSRDYDDNVRGDTPDIGAFEYEASSPSSTIEGCNITGGTLGP